MKKKPYKTQDMHFRLPGALLEKCRAEADRLAKVNFSRPNLSDVVVRALVAYFQQSEER